MNVNYLNIGHWFLWMATAVFMLAGCSDETLLETPAANQVLQLRFPQLEQVVTRVNDSNGRCDANANERWVDENSICLLFYDNTGKYLECWSKASGLFSYDETTGISLNRRVHGKCARIVVLCNVSPSKLSLLTVPFSELKDRLDESSWWGVRGYNDQGIGNGKGLPMCGVVEWGPNGVTGPCHLVLSVAKVQLVIDQKYENQPYFSWSVYHVPQSGNVAYGGMENGWNGTPDPLYPSQHLPVYSDYDIETDARQATHLKATYTNTHPIPVDTATYYMYVPEHQNSVLAKGRAVDPNTFDKDRMCIILKDVREATPRYYRLDFLTGNGQDETKEFFDLRRNRHYAVKITRFFNKGYATVEEALNNPSSNIEYSIEGVSEEYTTTNGQYSLDFTPDWTNLEYYGDDAVGKEVLIGYVKAIYPDGVDFAISTNNISLVVGDEEFLALVDPGQKITTERIPLKIRFNKQPVVNSRNSWSSGFNLKLQLGNIERTFTYSISGRESIDYLGMSNLFGWNEINGGMITVEKGDPEDFISLTQRANSESLAPFSLYVPANTTSAPRTQEAYITKYYYPGIGQMGDKILYKYKYMITQRAKE